MRVLIQLLTVGWLALATASASYTISKTKVAAPFREFIKARSRWLGDLVSCPYCVSHYLAGIAVLIYRPRVVTEFWPTDLGVAWLAVVALSAVVIGQIHQAIKGLVPPPPIPPLGKL